MATVNLLNNDWQTRKQTSSINIDATSTYVSFQLDASQTTGRAKACIEIDASKYKTISFTYSKVSRMGTTDLVFGVFDNMDPTDSSGVIILSWADFNATNGGSVSKDISSLSGTKYVGFWFYANTNNVGTCKEKPYITSLTAIERGYTLTYDANGGSGAPSSVSNITSTTISSIVPIRDGYDFLGWSTDEYATYASYVAGDSVSLTSNTTLYAVWRRIVYTITYNANGGSNAPSYQEKLHGEDLILTESKPTPPSRESVTYTIYFNTNGGICDTDSVEVNDYTEYYFEGWNSDVGGAGDTYYSGGKYSQDSSVTLYAQYSSYSYDAVTRLPTPTRENYDFLGWSTDPYATSGTTGNYNPTDNVTLYAIWKCKGNVYINDGSGFNPYQVLINDGSGWNQYIPYIYTESGWEVYSG